MGIAVPGRARFWRSPEGQPPWARPALLGIAVLTAVVYGWRIRDSGYATFYSIAAKSMTVSWRAFFYGALDPGATVTIDKLAGSFVPQALSARLFGYHAWSLTLPQVIEGVVAVLAMYRIGRRWLGPAVGLVAAFLFGLTPVVASMFGHPMEDGLLTMCLVLAADAFQRAVLEARLRSLLWSGVWVGVGFQAKMLQAWIILPALVITYLVAAPAPLRRRLAHLAVAGAMMLAVSLSWVGLYTVTPAHDRPYVDGSTNNSAFAMVFGYNGVDRFGLHIPGAVQSMFTGGGGAPRALPTGAVPGGAVPGGQAGRPGGGQAGPGPGGQSDSGWTKLVGSRYASQVGWLYPLALLGLVIGLVGRGRSPRTDPARTGYLLWGLWLATFAVVFSRIMIPHTAYMSSLAPAVAALSAAGVVQAVQRFRNGEARWLLPTLTVVELAWTVYLSTRFPTFLPWLPWLAAVLGAVAVTGLLVLRPPRYTVLAAALAAVSMLVVPTVWASSVLDPAYGGSAFDASAGPVSVAGPGGGGGPASFAGPVQVRQRGNTQGGFGPASSGSTTLDTTQHDIYVYVTAHRAGAQFLMATDSWNTAGPYIMATGQRVMPMGGFSGSVPQPTLAEAQRLVHTGALHFFLLSGGGFGPGRSTGGTAQAITTWVASTCAEIPSDTYGAADQSDSFGGGAATLYWCAGS